MRRRHSRQPSGKYLEHRTPVRVRFSEVDSLGVVWHGHYMTYFEDAREAFGLEFGIGYRDFVDAGFAAPVVRVACDYLLPLRYGDSCEAIARLYQRDSASLEFAYELWRAGDNVLIAAGSSTQVLVDAQGELVLSPPDFLRDFYARWEERFANNQEQVQYEQSGTEPEKADHRGAESRGDSA